MNVSVIIVCYNNALDIRPCLQSVFDTLPNDSQVIVVDNASSDATTTIVHVEFPHVLLICSETNLGFGDGNNLGAHHATGDILVFLNPDTLPTPGWLDALIAPLYADPSVGLVTPKILLAKTPERINTSGNSIHLSGLTLCRGMNAPASALSEAEDVGAVSGAAFAMRRDLFKALHGFDGTFFLYLEDTDLSMRARLMGWRILYTPESVVLHDYTLHIGPQKIYYQERNRYLMLLKSLRWPTLLALLPSLLFAECITWAFVIWHDRANFANKLRAYRWFGQNWPLVMHKRRAAQASRRVKDREMLSWMGYRLAVDQFSAGLVGQTAQFVFDSVYFMLRSVTLWVVRW